MPNPARRATDAPQHVDGLRALYEQAPASLAGNAIGIALIGLAFWPLADAPRLLGWLAMAVLLAALRLAHYLRYRAAPDSDGGRTPSATPCSRGRGPVRYARRSPRGRRPRASRSTGSSTILNRRFCPG